MREPVRRDPEAARTRRQGVPASARHLLPAYSAPVTDALLILGNLATARRAAGLADAPLPRSHEAVVGALRALAAGGTRIDEKLLLQLGEEELVDACGEMFGGVATAVTAAGLKGPEAAPPRHPPPFASARASAADTSPSAKLAATSDVPVSADDALEILDEVSDNLGREPTAAYLPPAVLASLAASTGRSSSP